MIPSCFLGSPRSPCWWRWRPRFTWRFIRPPPLESMTFSQPGWLALLLLLPFLGTGAILAARLRGRQWSAFVAPRLRGSLMKSATAWPRWLSLAFLLLACAALVVALARPHAEAGTKMEKTLGRNVMI